MEMVPSPEFHELQKKQELSENIETKETTDEETPDPLADQEDLDEG